MVREGFCSPCGEVWSDHIRTERRGGGGRTFQRREGVRPDCGDCGRKMRLHHRAWTVSGLAEMVYYCPSKQLAGAG